MFRNKKWIPFQSQNLKWYHELSLVFDRDKFGHVFVNGIHCCYEVLHGSLVRYHDNGYDLKCVQPKYPKIRGYFNAHVLVYKHWVYIFDRNHNEKFDLLTSNWINVQQHQNQFCMTNMFLLRNLFYMVFEYPNADINKKFMIVFDPETDTWDSIPTKLKFQCTI